MKDALSWYLTHQNEINLVKDLTFFFGAFGIVWSIWKFFRHLATKEIALKTEQIKKNLRFREFLDSKLKEYVYEKHKNGVKDIAVRFVHWKNYPWNLENDGYKHLLFIRRMDERVLPSGWIDNTGVLIEEPVWWFSKSIYCDERGIFFIGDKNKLYPNFHEMKDCRLILHLPFSNIIDFDFEELIEYEPVFYIKHAYNRYTKLYDPTYVCREKEGCPYIRIELNRRYQIKGYSYLRHLLAKAGYAVDRLFGCHIS
ncbi:MAG: hypothetical protein PHD48_12400 [Alphaproteobacteria bacterium]|nr:hypothetical protein [Alphaproteobacteria bacterium]